jgi:hypothetical protein
MSNDLFEWNDKPQITQPPSKDSEYRRIHVNFLSETAVAEYAKLVKRSITAKTKELWFPQQNDAVLSTFFEIEDSTYHESKRSKIVRVSDDLNVDVFDFDYEPGFYELHWQNMPEFHQPDSGAARQITHYFKSDKEVQAFAKLIDQNITKQTNSVWFPYREKNDVKDLYWSAK